MYNHTLTTVIELTIGVKCAAELITEQMMFFVFQGSIKTITYCIKEIVTKNVIMHI